MQRDVDLSGNLALAVVEWLVSILPLFNGFSLVFAKIVLKVNFSNLIDNHDNSPSRTESVGV